MRRPAPNEAEDTLHALRSGQVDAVVVYAPEGEKVLRLEGTEETYHLFMQEVNEGAAMVDARHVILDCNRSFARMVGREFSGVCGHKIEDFVSEREAHKLGNLLRSGWRGAAREELHLRSAADKMLPVQLSANPVKLRRARALCLVASDLSPVRQAQQALRDMEEFNSQIVTNAGSGIFVCDRDLRLLRWNPALAEITGLKSEDVIGRDCNSVFGSPVMLERLRKALAGQRSTSVDLPYAFRATNKYGWASFNFTPQRAADGRIVGVIAMARDITERIARENELKDLNRQLRELTARVQTVQEEQSARIALEVHDQLGQHLTAIKLNLSWLCAHLRGDEQQQREKIKDTVKLVDSTMRCVRRVASELRPGVLDNLGLAAAIEWQAQEFQSRTGVQCELNLVDDNADVPPEVATALFRIFQETLTNVARHSGASRIDVRLSGSARQLVLLVRDNGRGFDVSAQRHSSHFGLFGMRERVASLGGSLRISSAPGMGAAVVASIPAERGKKVPT